MKLIYIQARVMHSFKIITVMQIATRSEFLLGKQDSAVFSIPHLLNKVREMLK